MTKTNNKILVLIDGNALVHRAFHALPPLATQEGLVTNAVFGFSSMIIKTIKDLRPDYIAATFDLAGPTFRHKEFSEYKIHRVKAPQELYDQIPIVKDILRAFGIPVYEKEGYEADDLIGSLVSLAEKEKGLDIIISTGDLDTLQLVNKEKTRVLTLRKGMTDTVIYDEKMVIERFGIKPEQMNDFKGLKGDPSDNIPGVPGVGEKTASTLIIKYGSIENLYEKLESKKGIDKKDISEKMQEKLKEFKDQAFFSKQLSVIVRNVDIDFSLKNIKWRDNASREKIEELFKKYGFASLLRRLSEIDLGPQGSFDDMFSGVSNNEEVKTEDKIEVAFSSLNKVALLSKDKKYVVVHKIDNDVFLFCEDKITQLSLTESKDIDELSVLMTDDSIEKIGHNIKDVIKYLLPRGVQVLGDIFDIQIVAYLLNVPSRFYELGDLYEKKKKAGLNNDQLSILSAINDLYLILKQELSGSTSEKYYREIDMPLIRVLAIVESKGILVDTSVINSLRELSTKSIKSLEKKIYSLAGLEFNINSPQQLGNVLFDDLGLKGKTKKTTGGARSTAVSELEKLSGEHPIVNLIMEYRELQKLKSTYIESFPAWINEADSRIHTTFNQVGAATGRLSSQDPNMQNIPVRTELGQEFRKAFIVPKKYKMVSFDYSQIELRIASHLANDKKMIEAFQNGEDIHTRTASEVFGVKPDDVDSEMRRQAKALNFGVLYGMGVLGFMRSAGVDRNKAREFIDSYFREFSGIAEYMERIKIQTKKDGFVETIFGHRRYIPEISSQMPQLRAQGERMAINMPMQGSVADIVKKSMKSIQEYIEKNSFSEKISMLLQVHDELLFEIADDLVEEAIPEIVKIMQNIYELRVPLVVDVKIGDNWGEMNKIK